jgi:hypothetical protein
MLAVAGGNQHRLAARQVALAVAVTAQTLVLESPKLMALLTPGAVAGRALPVATAAVALEAPVLSSFGMQAVKLRPEERSLQPVGIPITPLHLLGRLQRNRHGTFCTN